MSPSADNSQPWRYRWAEDALELWIDRERSGHVSDAHYMLSDLAIGACIENMAIRSLALGLSIESELFPQAQDEPLFAARLRWQAAEPHESPMLAAIATRHTDRRLLWRGPVEDDCKQRLSRQAATHPGADLIWMDGKAREIALKAIWMAEALRFSSRSLHGELFSSIRFEAGRRGECDEGLAPASLAVEAPMWPLFKAMRQWPLMRTMRVIGGAQLIGIRAARLPAALAPALALLSVDGTERKSIVTAGRAMQRVWLQAEADGLAVQPLAAAGVLTLGGPDIEPRLQPRLKKIRACLDDIIGTGHGVLFLRMGKRPAHPPARSGRRALTTFSLGS